MATKFQPVRDNQPERGHTYHCDGCGVEGVCCDTDYGIVDRDGRELAVDFGDDLVSLLVGKTDGTRTNEWFCEDCADELND